MKLSADLWIAFFVCLNQKNSPSKNFTQGISNIVLNNLVQSIQ